MPEQLNLGDMTPEERNARAAAGVGVYGLGTKSYNASSEKREMDRQRKTVTEKYESGELSFADQSRAFLVCRCRSFAHSHPAAGHDIRLHDELQADYDWRLPKQRTITYGREYLR